METEFNRHREFNGKISKNLYNCLEVLSLIGNRKAVQPDDMDLLKTIKTIPLDVNRLLEDRLKLPVYYIRLTVIIGSLLEEYKNYDENFRKAVIDYYIFSNNIKEMNNIGFGWYYDMKFKKQTATLYSVGYGAPSNWSERLKSDYDENNQIKENGIQFIFRKCKEHINRGGRIRLKSLSKCLGVDLFKYMQIDRNNFANLYIIKDAPLNFIEYDNRRISLHEYLLSDTYESFDVNQNPGFCLDFSHPRNDKAVNYDKWSKNFLNNQYVSQAEFVERKKASGMENNIYDYFILNCLKTEHANGCDKAWSSRVSPVADKEVVVSDTLWEIIEYGEEVKPLRRPEECYHIAFSESEYCQLIFSYFRRYYEVKGDSSQTAFYERYVSQLAGTKRSIENNIMELQEKYNQLSDPDSVKSEDEVPENKKKERNTCSFLISSCSSLKKFLDTTVADAEKPNEKVQFVLSFVDWSTEIIPKNWSLNNLYHVKENREKNLNLNFYKYLCKQAAI